MGNFGSHAGTNHLSLLPVLDMIHIIMQRGSNFASELHFASSALILFSEGGY